VGRYYGSKSIYAGLDDAAREAWIEEHKTGKVRRKPSKSSCVGWALNNLRAAYTKVGERERWTKHQAVIAANKSRGTDIATELLKDGWVAIYFNPDVRKPADGSNEHPLTARIALRSGTYYGIPVTHRVVNYRPSPGSGTARSIAGMRKLAKVPYWFGISRGGTHTFMGSRGNVNEFHWRSGPADPNAIEVTPLARFDWLSGLIVVPPGTWPE
jgi:hypothetical protein